MPGPISQSYDGPDDDPIELPEWAFGDDEADPERSAIPGPGQFRCEMCERVFDVGDGDDEEARIEAEANGFDPNDCGMVCDDCFQSTPWGSP